MNYAAEQRLRTIDLLVDQYGTIQRSVVMEMYGISPACATRDFRTYRDLAPDNLVFDERSKNYLKSTNFKRIYA